MEKIAPEIIRQRLLIEGYYDHHVDKKMIENFFEGITQHLKLRTYQKPIIYVPDGLGREENKGFDAFVPLVDSGIALYVWTPQGFLSLIMYTCKQFDNKEALAFTKNFFNMKDEIVILEF